MAFSEWGGKWTNWTTGVDLFGSENKEFNRKMAEKNYELALRQQALSEQSFEYQKWFDQNNVQLKMDQYAKNGINPILATEGGNATAVGTFQGGSPVPSVPGSSSELGTIASLLGSMLNKDTSNKQIDEMKRQFDEHLKAQTEQFYAKLKSDEDIALRDRNSREVLKFAELDSNEKINRLNRTSEERIEEFRRALERELQDKKSTLAIDLQSMQNSDNEKDRQNAQNIQKMINKQQTKNALINAGGSVLSAMLNAGGQVARTLMMILGM